MTGKLYPKWGASFWVPGNWTIAATVQETQDGRFRVDFQIGPSSTWNGLDYGRTLGDAVTSTDRFLKAVASLAEDLDAAGLADTLPAEVGALILKALAGRQDCQNPAGGIDFRPAP